MQRDVLIGWLGEVSHPHLPLAGTEVEVEAALEPLVDEGGEGRNLAQAGELLGNKGVLPVLRVLLLPHRPLQGVRKVGGDSKTGRESEKQRGEGNFCLENRYSGGQIEGGQGDRTGDQADRC